jgi:gas vesicle protein
MIQRDSLISFFEDADAVDRREMMSQLRPQVEEEPQNNTNLNATIDALSKQILGQGTSSRWTGTGYGSAEANAKDMAKILAGIGITDINQFGPIEREVEDYVGTDDQGNPIYQTRTEQTYGNKLTGQVVPTTYSERQTGNAWGGTFEGKGNTGYRVDFSTGKPIFYTTGASSNDLSNLMQDFGPLGQIALAVATGGLSIPQQIAAQMAVQVLSGKDIGDAVKGAAISWAGAQIPGLDAIKEGSAFLKGIDPSGVLSNAFQNAAVSGGRAVLTGQDVSDAVLRGATTGGINGATNAFLSAPEFSNLTNAEKRIAANAITGVISGKPIDQILINSAIAAANASLANSKRGEQPVAGIGSEKDFIDTEKARLTAAGYSKDQIKNYLGNLENLTEELDYEPNKIFDFTEPARTPADSELKYLPTDDDFVPTVRDPNELIITAPSEQPQENVFDPTFGGTKPLDVFAPNTVEVVGARPPAYLPTDNDFPATPINDMGTVEVVANRPPAYLPTDNDFPATPIRDEGELEIVDKRPPKYLPTDDDFPPTPTAKTPVSPSKPNGGSGSGGSGGSGFGLFPSLNVEIGKMPNYALDTKLSYKKVSDDGADILNPLLFSLAGVPLPFSQVPTNEKFLTDDEEKVKKEEFDREVPSLDSINITSFADGGFVPRHPMGEPEFYSEGGAGDTYIQGRGDGTSDQIPAMVANSEYVLPADVVSALGNGSSDSGASVLDQFIKVIREHKHSNSPDDLPPQSKGPLEYLASVHMKGKRK